MTKNEPKAKIDSKTRICMEDGCVDASQVKGYCRLHFLRALSLKGENQSLSEFLAEKKKERRSGNRLKSLEPDHNKDEDRIVSQVERMTELDGFVEIDGFDEAIDAEFEALKTNKVKRRA